jgi:hypothetical protein
VKGFVAGSAVGAARQGVMLLQHGARDLDWAAAAAGTLESGVVGAAVFPLAHLPAAGPLLGMAGSAAGAYEGVKEVREGEWVGYVDAGLSLLGFLGSGNALVGGRGQPVSSRSGIGGAVEGGEAAAGTGPKLWVYTRKPVGDVLEGGAAGRAWATHHGPGKGWATEPGFWNAVRRAWRTGRAGRYQYVKEIPETAAGQFTRVKGIGLFRGWKYAGGQYFTKKPGDLNLVTGRITGTTFKQSVKYYRELALAHGLDAAQWVVGWATYDALTPEGTTSSERGQ